MSFRRVRATLVSVVTVVAVAAASIALGLAVTPLQAVSALGETVRVGAAPPGLTWSGPGELDLFGQSFPTVVRFAGPVRPRLVLSHITVNRQIAELFPGAPGSHSASQALGTGLADGFTRYALVEMAIVGAASLVLLGAIAGWRRSGWRRTLTLLIAGFVVVEALNVGGVMYAAFSAPQVLGRVGSLDQLVGRAPVAPVPASGGPEQHGVHAVVLGDSTAAGDGLAPVPNPSRLDRACQRSVDSYGAVLARVNDWQVLNLACSSATIEHGLLGPQQIGGLVAPAQLGLAKEARGASVVIVSIGADDMTWSAIFRLCAISPVCNNNAITAYFQSKLATFTQDYFDLLRQLAALPGHPEVIVNSYYDPFDPSSTCLRSKGLTEAKVKVLIAEVKDLDAVLAKGAEASGFASVQPNFSGHQLCSPVPYVQGLSDKAPFHPTVAGQLAIAVADEGAIAKGGRGAAKN
ncbi:MAG: SGNH/GDSL hydrolase family protein [Acidimicrobiales bacterium]